MRIVRAHSRIEELPLTRPYRIAYASFDRVRILVVELETEDGLTGLGTGSPVEPVTGEALEPSAAALSEHLDELLVGADVRHLRRLLRRLESTLPRSPAARAAVDVALHDLAAKALGLPLVELLGRAHESLPTSVTIGIKDSPEEAVAEAEEHAGNGFVALKLKIGESLEQDVETVSRVRRAVGPEVSIWVDANQGYSAEETARFFAATEELGIEFVEQPVAADESASMLSLPEELRRRSAADESLQSPADALRLAAEPLPFGIFNIKLMKCGGVSAAAKIAQIARLAGIGLLWGCMDESVTSISAALHVALASPATRYLDLDGSFDLARDVARGGFVLERGRLAITDRPGLGVELFQG